MLFHSFFSHSLSPSLSVTLLCTSHQTPPLPSPQICAVLVRAFCFCICLCFFSLYLHCCCRCSRLVSFSRLVVFFAVVCMVWLTLSCYPHLRHKQEGEGRGWLVLLVAFVCFCCSVVGSIIHPFIFFWGGGESVGGKAFFVVVVFFCLLFVFFWPVFFVFFCFLQFFLVFVCCMGVAFSFVLFGEERACW